jgi:hypothetical protein
VATADEPDGRIHFDVGEHEASVELTSVALFRLDDGRQIRPQILDLDAGG